MTKKSMKILKKLKSIKIQKNQIEFENCNKIKQRK